MGELSLTFAVSGGRTEIKESFFTAPHKVAKPFYRDRYTEVIIMEAGAGLFGGDRFSYAYHLREGAAACIRGQSYLKVFPGQGGAGVQRVDVRVESGASLFYLPPPVIPFAGSAFDGSLHAHLAPDCQVILLDAFACGRVGMGEEFRFESFTSAVRVSVDGAPVFIDRNVMRPADMPLTGLGFFEGYTHGGYLYLYGYDAQFEEIRALCRAAGEDMECACSRAGEGVVIRLLCANSDDIVRFAEKVRGHITIA
jgi:urease accessory protein